MSNLFKPNTKSYKDFETMSDMKWHCRCELEAAQAKTWQTWRHRGIQLDVDEKGNYYKRVFCPSCGRKTYHRKLLSLELAEDTTIRSNMPAKLAKRIKLIYDYEEAVLLRKLLPRELEIDHRLPQKRWGQNENINDINMSETEIRSKFILLTRSNNQLKSRYCEKCVKTGKRGQFPGIYYWYEGNNSWDSKINPNDKNGCIGCFWYNPYKWRESLNNLVKKNR